jgi:acyl dehydratase
MRSMNDHSPSLPLPPMSAARLLQALFKRPDAAGAAAASVAAEPVRHRLDRIDDDGLARYRSALGFTGEHVPLTYYYLLAQRAQLAALLGQPLPFRLAGIIHVDNTLSAGAQPLRGRRLELRTTVEVGAPAADGAVHAVLDTHAEQDGQAVFSCHSTYLAVRGRRGSRRHLPHPPSSHPAPAPLASWQLSPSSGREYARMSGDWNPIHLWPWTARLMGLRAPIIHGMHTQARVCAELERAGARPVAALDGRFRAPVPLGSVVTLAADLGTGRYLVEAGGRLAVEGGFVFA